MTFWQFNINKCPGNCSNHGSCKYGFCFCDNGYYGIDCSNTSCPGTFCYYDDITNEQICNHCCHSGHSHSDGEPYLSDVRKVPCDKSHPGESNGICDGFGNCQCAPPFITDDCSVKDCPNNCSGHGWCSVEYPVSRCMCDSQFYGLDCSGKGCLNNCSWPHGDCISGNCVCRRVFDPYNNTLDFAGWPNCEPGQADEEWLDPYGTWPPILRCAYGKPSGPKTYNGSYYGPDCSYFTAYAGTPGMKPGTALATLCIFLAILFLERA